MNSKIISFRIFISITLLFQVLAGNAQNSKDSVNQTENITHKKKVANLNSKDLGDIVFEKTAKKFFMAFGKLFEQNSFADIDSTNLFSTNDSNSEKLSKEVFGFHPYWLENSLESYDYELLSSVSYSAYDLDPYTGKYKTIRDWKTTKLIDFAKSNNIKVYLTVTNSLKENNIRFFKGSTAKEAQETSIYTILRLLKQRETHGVTIHFEDVPFEVKNEYTNYIQNLSRRLKEFKKNVVITLPAIDDNYCFDLMALDSYVEYFVIRGNNYYGSWSDFAGPVAPLYGDKLWNRGSIEYTIDSYLERGISKEKFILAVPYYGSKWQTTDDNIPSKSIKFIENLSFKAIKKHYPQKAYFEPESQTNYLNFKEGEKFIQIWFDDSKSLGKKYDFINIMELAGVGILDLGDDDGHSELWDVLDVKFKQNKGYVPRTEMTWASIFKKKSLLKGLFLVAVLIFSLGFLFSLRNYEIREIVFKKDLIKNLILLGVPFLLFVVMYFSLKEKVWSFIILTGILIGYGLYYLLVRSNHKFNNLNRIP